MAEPATLLALGHQALVVERARQAAKTLRQERSGLLCATADDSRQPWERCYNRSTTSRGDPDALPLPLKDWCNVCQDRERVHQKFTDAANRQRVERMRLTKMATRALATEEDDDLA